MTKLKFSPLLKLGVQAIAVPYDVPAYLKLKIAKPSYYSALAAHEFGHLIGLRHEDIHPDAAKDPQCNGKAAEEPLSEQTKIEKYDPNSIMNRCYLNKYFEGTSATGNGRASSGDRAAARMLSMGAK